jgi:hypothetical protein
MNINYKQDLNCGKFGNQYFPLLQDDSEYSRLQHPGGQHAPQGMKSRAHRQQIYM